MRGRSGPDRRRALIVGILVTVICAGQLIAVATSQELWPFSPYPMYADLSSCQSFTVVRLIGVTQGKHSRAVTIDAAWLRKQLTQLASKRQPTRQLRKALAAYVHRYGWRRPTDSRQHGDTLRELRIYQQRWNLQRDAKNFSRPDSTTLLAQAIRPVNGGQVGK
jgi:hypothetical protein